MNVSFVIVIGLPFDFSYKFYVYFVPIITKKMKGVVIWTLMCLIFWIVSRALSFEELRSISVKDEMKRKLRQFMMSFMIIMLGFILKARSLLII